MSHLLSQLSCVSIFRIIFLTNKRTKIIIIKKTQLCLPLPTPIFPLSLFVPSYFFNNLCSISPLARQVTIWIGWRKLVLIQKNWLYILDERKNWRKKKYWMVHHVCSFWDILGGARNILTLADLLAVLRWSCPWGRGI